MPALRAACFNRRTCFRWPLDNRFRLVWPVLSAILSTPVFKLAGETNALDRTAGRSRALVYHSLYTLGTLRSIGSGLIPL